MLPLPDLPAQLRPTAAYGAAIFHALARDEAAERRPPRLTEPGHATWHRFRDLLGWSDLLCLLAEDAAVAQPVPFDAGRMLAGHPGLDQLDDQLVGRWIEALPELDLDADGVDYLMAQARTLGIPERMARSDLHKVHPHHRILGRSSVASARCLAKEIVTRKIFKQAKQRIAA